MLIRSDNLIGLPAETKSGLLLGKVKNLEIDNENHTVERYIIKRRNLIGNLLRDAPEELIVGRAQVLSIDEEKMIVEDGAVEMEKKAKLTRGLRENVPAISSRLSAETDGK